LNGLVIKEQVCPTSSTRCLQATNVSAKFYPLLFLRSYNNSMKPAMRFEANKNYGHLGMMHNDSRDDGLKSYPQHLKE
jgi:hypothetical protein